MVADPSIAERVRTFLIRSVFSTLNGITFGDWWRLLCRCGFAVDPAYLPRACFVTATSLMNSVQAQRERRSFGADLARARVHPPLFILGHYRSGTTYLHYLLSKDHRLACPNVFQTDNPHTFLTTEETHGKLVQLLTIRKRPMDDVRIDVTTPNEDELALCTMTAMSPYLGLVFPRRAADFDRYLTFRNARDDEVQAWRHAMWHFVQKLSLRYDRPLVLKSPPHTARIRLLLELFPEARFLHIHRHPYTVFQSTRHLLERLGPLFHLQRPLGTIEAGAIIRRYVEMYDAYFEDLPLIRPGRLAEVRFATLEEDPIGEMRRVYEALGLGDFAATEPAMRSYVASLTGFRKNTFPPLGSELRTRIAKEWSRSFERWSYEP